MSYNMNQSANNPKENFDISWIQKDTKCWVYQPNQNQGEIYLRGIVKGIIPLSINKANSKISGMLENGSPFEARANQIQKCRDSNSLQRDLIDMDIINPPEVLRQLKRRLADRKIHTLIWNSLIIVNPFRFITQNYGEKILASYFEHIFLKKQDVKKHEPHIYSFIMHILSSLSEKEKVQVISICGESGSGKTEANKQALKAISFSCSKIHQKDKQTSNTPESKILNCDPILQTFGNAKTVKNDNSSRFGKLVTLIMDGHTLRIHQVMLKSYFLEKSRIISQNLHERNFHIFYQLLAYLPEDQRYALRLKNHGHLMRFDDFAYLTNRTTNTIPEDRKMWDDLNFALNNLKFGADLIRQIWSVVAATLLMGNLNFDMVNDDEPCEVRNPEVADSIAFLLGLQTKEFVSALTTHKRVIGGEVVVSPLNVRHCREGRDSVAKAMYESLFLWLVNELNARLNQSNSNPSEVKIIKLLDIYGFEVFDHNSFQQLCVNFTNQKIHQIYLQQIFIHQQSILKRQGLESIIKALNFTDNIKIIELIETNNRSLFNLLDQSCSVNVRDDDFLNSVKKHHDHHDHFPPSNLVNTRKSFIIKHTPGDIEYMIEGFREKNKDLIRDDLLARLTAIKIRFIANAFKDKHEALKQEGNKRFLSIKIRKQVKELITEMSSDTDMHFIRCIKPNEKKLPFTFIDRVCYNQIRYLGILDTIQMRKDTYHVRIPYPKFYQKYGILEDNLQLLVDMSQGRITSYDSKEAVMKFVNDLNVHYDLDYQFGRQRIFLKMSAQHRLDTLLNKKLYIIEHASTRIKVQYRHYKMKQQKKIIKTYVPKIQRAIKDYLIRKRIYREKVAVQKIENAWIQYHIVFFARKKYSIIRMLQKYIKCRKEELLMKNKIDAVARAKGLLRSIAASNKQLAKLNVYKQVKSMVKGQIYDMFWQSLCAHYLSNLQKYLHGGRVVFKHSQAISRAEEVCNYRLNIKYRRDIERYIRGFLSNVHYLDKIKSIIRIQSFFRMSQVRSKYQNLRDKAVLIQRNWRKYYYDKQYNIMFTEKYFGQGAGGSINTENELWKQNLYRNLEGKQQQASVQRLLQANERVKMDKIGLFYYLLDFQILGDLSHIYPNNAWMEHYLTLYQQCWQKGNPIQMIDVSDTQTIASTLNKVYIWGDMHFQDFDSEKPTYQSWKNIKTPQIPPGKINKVHAHNHFSVVQVENQEPFIIGDRRMYEEDCSAKEWKTLRESYIIINGVVLTLKKVQFSRIQISEKVVQLSCGMAHCIARTSLRKLYTWGDNSNGQLGLGHFYRVTKPKLLDYFSKQAITIQQATTSAYGSIALDSHNRLYWWGTNNSIKNMPFPKEVYLFEKSSFLDNPNKYSVIRILSSWSKSLSLIGITVASHQGIFKISQSQVKKKTYENLITKWNQDILTVMPPFVQTISGYFQQKFMPKPKVYQQQKGAKELEHQRIRQKILSQITLMEEAERALLKERKRF